MDEFIIWVDIKIGSSIESINEQIRQYHLWNYYICDISSLTEEFRLYLLKSWIEHDYLIKIKQWKYLRTKNRANLELPWKNYYYIGNYLKTKNECINAACDALIDTIYFWNHLVCKTLNENLNPTFDDCLVLRCYHFLWWTQISKSSCY